MRNITVKEGEPIYLDVKVSGEPAPDVAWFVNGKSLQPTNHKRVDNIPYNTKFYNDNPERKDTGTYKIVAQNKYGQDQEEIEITVICKCLRFVKITELNVNTKNVNKRTNKNVKIHSVKKQTNFRSRTALHIHSIIFEMFEN